MTPEDIREFEKAPKSLIKMQGNEILFADDAVGKMRFIYDAFENKSGLIASAKEVLAAEEGGKHLVRALNNLKKINHKPAMVFAEVVYTTVKPEWDLLTRVQKCQQLLDSVDEDYSGESDWLDIETEAVLDELRIDPGAQLMLWSAWVGANLRSVAKSEKLIRLQAPRRPQTLTKPLFNQLVRTMNDAEERWEYRAAAMYALVGAHAMGMYDAQCFMDAAYTAFPLEALAGIEALSMALEMDAAAYAEQEVISAKLAQVRQDHLILRDMNRESFVAAAERLLANQANLSNSAVDIAVSLQSLDKNDRMMATILIDDMRRSEFVQMAAKFQMIKPIAKMLFKDFNAENKFCIALSQALVMALTEIENMDAVLAENWMDACEAGDSARLKALVGQFEAI